MENYFYVYEWFNIDTGEVFYVGKGKGNRYKNTTQRNQYFKNYLAKHKCNVRKIKIDLLEKDAFDLEISTIKKYRELDQCKCNIADGGEGGTYPKNSRAWIYAKLHYLWYMTPYLGIMENEEDYDPENLKSKTAGELWGLWVDYKETRHGDYTYNEMLEEHCENGDIGWECFDD